MLGGAFLCYEGAHKILHALQGDDHDHDVPAVASGPEAEEATIAGAIRTDFILSGEIIGDLAEGGGRRAVRVPCRDPRRWSPS